MDIPEDETNEHVKISGAVILPNSSQSIPKEALERVRSMQHRQKERSKKMDNLPDGFLTTADWKEATSGIWNGVLEAIKLQTTKSVNSVKLR